MTMRNRKGSIAKRETRMGITFYFFNYVIKLFKSKRVIKDKILVFYNVKLALRLQHINLFRHLLKKVYERNIRRSS